MAKDFAVSKQLPMAMVCSGFVGADKSWTFCAAFEPLKLRIAATIRAVVKCFNMVFVFRINGQGCVLGVCRALARLASRLQAAFFSVRSLTAFRSIVELVCLERGLSDPGNPDARRPASKKAPDFKQLPPK